MDWTNTWINLFGTTQWLGLNMGFWVSMGIVTLLVVLMNIVFWGMKPKADTSGKASSSNKQN